MESLVNELGLTRNSERLQKVRKYYKVTLTKMIKYFSVGIKSSSLRAMVVLDPKIWKKDLDFLRKQWRILAELFPDVVSSLDIPDLLCEVSNLSPEV